MFKILLGVGVLKCFLYSSFAKTMFTKHFQILLIKNYLYSELGTWKDKREHTFGVLINTGVESHSTFLIYLLSLCTSLKHLICLERAVSLNPQSSNTLSNTSLIFWHFSYFHDLKPKDFIPHIYLTGVKWNSVTEQRIFIGHYYE